jgi:hypothetical protein
LNIESTMWMNPSWQENSPWRPVSRGPSSNPWHVCSDGDLHDAAVGREIDVVYEPSTE